ncbi:hydrolase 1, exosortase A system-associated [Massilia cavernae]|nr:hydrolase 1, exosortase A system-associated [Massilia cavernae]
MNFDQRALRFCCAGSWLVGIVDVPERPIERGLLVVTDTAQYRVGGHRQFTLLSRTLAGRGIPVMRFDHRGCGDSEGEPRAFNAIGEDIRTAIGEFFMQMPELKEIVIWGLGHAAAAAVLYAHLDPCVRGLVLLNPNAGVPEPEPRTGGRQQYIGRLGELAFWKKAPRGDGAVPVADSLASFTGQALVVTGGGDGSTSDFIRLAGKHVLKYRHVEIPHAGHTFASREWRDEVARLTAHWVVTW